MLQPSSVAHLIREATTVPLLLLTFLFAADSRAQQNPVASLRSGYGLDQVPATGAGQMIAIIANGSFDRQKVVRDLRTFSNDAGLSEPQISFVYVGPRATVGKSPDWNLEVALDTQMAHAFAPDARIVVFADAGFIGQPLRAVKAAVNYGANVVSMSFAGPELAYGASGIAAWEAVFSAHPEISFVAASGDFGANKGQVSYPASSPSVLAVGGVNEDFSANPVAASFSGGGLSQVFATPSYQADIPLAASRALPDLAMNSTGDLAVVYVGATGGYRYASGTSFAAPAMAGVIATANELRGAPVGDVHPILYALPPQSLRDPIAGQNDLFAAGVGFDLVTGLGVPNVVDFISALANQ